MIRLVEIFRAAPKRPMEAIEAILAISMLLAGVYLLLPWYQSPPGSSSAQAFEDTVYGPIVYAIVAFVLPPMPILAGFFFERFRTYIWRTRSTFWMFVALIFTSILRVVAIGLVPVTWIASLACGIISAVCYLHVRLKR